MQNVSYPHEEDLEGKHRKTIKVISLIYHYVVSIYHTCISTLLAGGGKHYLDKGWIRGAVVFFSDFWSTDEFDRNNFLKRNRIIAGLSEATIVIESAEKGGSLVTADIANSYNREVFAVPGRITDSQSVGCNNLIKLQRAHLLSKPEDIPYILNWKLDNEEQPT